MTVLISHLTAPDVLQACTGLRYLVGPLADPAAWNNEGHNRTIYAVTADGKLLVLCTEGGFPNMGVLLQECREFMITHGAVLAADFGGGGDVTAFDRQEGRLLIATQNGTQTYLPNFMTFTAKENNSMDGLAKEKFGSQTRVRKTPSRYGEIVTTLNGYAEVAFTEPVPALISGTSDKAGEMWLKLTNGNYVNFKLYNSVGVLTDYFTITRQPSNDPLPADSITIDITAYDVKVTGDQYSAVGIKLNKTK